MGFIWLLHTHKRATAHSKHEEEGGNRKGKGIHQGKEATAEIFSLCLIGLT